jgi:hypothetical protein
MKEPKHTGFSILKGKTYEDGIKYERARILKALKSELSNAKTVGLFYVDAIEKTIKIVEGKK